MSKLRKATRQKAKIRLALSGPAGSGKTISALLIAYGMVGDWNKIAVIDTESNSADLYANHNLTSAGSQFTIGEFQVYELKAPFTPERYIEAIQDCVASGMEAVIIDSVSHEWMGSGGILEIVDTLKESSNSKNAFTNGWSTGTAKHNKFLEAMMSASCHIIGTMRSKQEYTLVEENGKKVPKKLGLNPQQRDGVEYEFTLHLDLSMNNHATAMKDRTGLFMGKTPFISTVATGTALLEWCESGVDVAQELAAAVSNLDNCATTDELTLLKETLPQYIVDNPDFKKAGVARYNIIKPKNANNVTA